MEERDEVLEEPLVLYSISYRAVKELWGAGSGAKCRIYMASLDDRLIGCVVIVVILGIILLMFVWGYPIILLIL